MGEEPSAGWRPLIRSVMLPGLGGGVVLAGFLAVAAAVYARPPFRPADLVWLWPLLLAVAAPLLALVLLAATAVVTRRGGATPVSFLLGLSVLAYLGLIWWRADVGEGRLASGLYLLLAAGVASFFVFLVLRICSRGSVAAWASPFLFLVLGISVSTIMSLTSVLTVASAAAPFEVR